MENKRELLRKEASTDGVIGKVGDGLFGRLDAHQANGESGRDREFRIKWLINGDFSEMLYAVKASVFLIAPRRTPRTR